MSNKRNNSKWFVLLCSSLLVLSCRSGDSPRKTGTVGQEGAVPQASLNGALESGTLQPRAEALRPRRVPPPLGPRVGESAGATDDEVRPCLLLVNRLCALLSEGAEECGQARNRVVRRAGTVSEKRCESALAWYHINVENVSTVRACNLLARETCRDSGAESRRCANARLDAEQLRGEYDSACLAQLLLLKGLP